MLDPVQRAKSLGLATPVTIALAEGDDERVLEAAMRAQQAGFCRPLLVRDDPVDGVETLSPDTYSGFAALVEQLRSRLTALGKDSAEAGRLAQDRLYFTCLLVAAGAVDGAVMGAVETTSATLRAALRSIGPKPGLRTVSSSFLMILPDGRGLIYSDCGVVPDPDAEMLAEIAISAAETARLLLDEEPRVALLSFSTHGSAAHPAVEKVRRAGEILGERDVDFEYDAELQADAALVPAIARRKAPGSSVAGNANVLVFPDLNAGNIAYKLTERLAGARALGPLLQGLGRPVNDLSRGCSAKDILEVMAVTTLSAAAGMRSEEKDE